MTQLKVWEGDITTLAVDVIVNAANSELAGGGGVDGAIHRAAGKHRLQAVCRKIGGCPTGEVRVTPGFNLPARYIFHAVGPVWRGGQNRERKLLASCYRQALQLANQYRVETIAFPAISCGVYGYPLEEAVACAVETVSGVVVTSSSLKEVVFCCFSTEMTVLYRKALNQYHPGTDG